jgi:hypothetical protein
MVRPATLTQLLLIGVTSVVTAQEQSAEKPPQPERLFRSREPLALTLRAPFGDLFKDRDTLVAKPQEGTLEFTDPRRGPVTMPVTLETRGHFRLRRGTCGFAPLKVTFDKEASKGSEFNDQKSLKLVTHCQNGSRYEQNLLVEESIYRMYNALTPLSHRTRLAQIRYLPVDDSSKAVTKYGFFLEDDDDLAKRNKGTLLMQQGGSFSDMEPLQMDLVATFEYMIGNTDWSVFAIHNIRVLDVGSASGGFYYPVAYDFDFSGLVGSTYAAPDERLPIKSVKTRLYRGPCRKLEELLPTIELFNSRRDSIYATLREQPGLEPKRLQEATDYLDGFFDQIKKPKDFNGALGYACRG